MKFQNVENFGAKFLSLMPNYMLIPGMEKNSDNNIIQVVEDYYKLKGSTGIDRAGQTIYIYGIKTKRRFRSLVVARQVCMYLMRKHTQKTYHEIADEFDMDHSTVIAAEKQINNLLTYDKNLRKQIENLENMLTLKNEKLAQESTFPQNLEEKRELALQLAWSVLPIYESKYPNDSRVKDCLQAIEDYKNGKITVEILIEKRQHAAAAAAAAYSAADAAAAAADAAAAAAAADAAAAYAAAYSAAYAAAAAAAAAADAAAAYSAAAYSAADAAAYADAAYSAAYAAAYAAAAAAADAAAAAE